MCDLSVVVKLPLCLRLVFASLQTMCKSLDRLALALGHPFTTIAATAMSRCSSCSTHPFWRIYACIVLFRISASVFGRCSRPMLPCLQALASVRGSDAKALQPGIPC